MHNEREKAQFEQDAERYVVAWDPVCQMKTRKSSGPHAAVETAVHNGTRYYFCDRGERDQFVKDPQKYVRRMKKSR